MMLLIEVEIKPKLLSRLKLFSCKKYYYMEFIIILVINRPSEAQAVL